MDLVPGTPYDVVYKLPGGGEGTARLTYLQSRSGASAAGGDTDNEGRLHRFRVVGDGTSDFPELFQTPVASEVEIPARALVSAEPLD